MGVLLPLRIQRHIAGNSHALLIRIGNAAAVRLRVPAGKGIAVSGKCIGRQRLSLVRLKFLRLHRAAAAVRIERHGVDFGFTRVFDSKLICKESLCTIICRSNNHIRFKNLKRKRNNIPIIQFQTISIIRNRITLIFVHSFCQFRLLSPDILTL